MIISNIHFFLIKLFVFVELKVFKYFYVFMLWFSFLIANEPSQTILHVSSPVNFVLSWQKDIVACLLFLFSHGGAVIMVIESFDFSKVTTRPYKNGRSYYYNWREVDSEVKDKLLSYMFKSFIMLHFISFASLAALVVNGNWQTMRWDYHAIEYRQPKWMAMSHVICTCSPPAFVACYSHTMIETQLLAS